MKNEFGGGIQRAFICVPVMMDMVAMFRNREHAGRVLVSKLSQYARNDDAVLLALPRGGVVVAFEISQELQLPLDLFVVRKIGVPGHEELALGAIATGGVLILNESLKRMLGVSNDALRAVMERESRELDRRESTYRGGKPPLDLAGRVAILVDDGLATGSTMLAAIEAVRRRDANRVVAAVPVAPPDTCEKLKEKVDEIVCAVTPEQFYGVGQWYDDFSEVSDQQVKDLLQRASEVQVASSGIR